MTDEFILDHRSKSFPLGAAPCRAGDIGSRHWNLLADDLAYTTVLTILRTLEQKGYVQHEEEGRVHRYFAAVREDAARKSALQHLTGKLFKGSAELLFTHLVADRKLSKEQIERMRELLASAGKKEK